MAASLVILLGAPGAGKSVQSRLLAQQRGWVRISTGELLRANPSPELAEILRSGQLAPSSAVQDLLLDRLKAIGTENVILDGFPRMLSEAQWLDHNLNQVGLKLTRVVLLTIERSVSLQRLAERGRGDDDPQALQQRWQEFEQRTQPVIAHYRQQDLLSEVDGVGTVEAVAQRLAQAI